MFSVSTGVVWSSGMSSKGVEGLAASYGKERSVLVVLYD